MLFFCGISFGGNETLGEGGNFNGETLLMKPLISVGLFILHLLRERVG